MDPLLDRVSETLIDLGIHVTRGPGSVPGLVTEFPRKDQERYLQDVDVLLVSSRWRLSTAALENSTRLRGVVAPTIGVEAIDIDHATKLGILVGHGAIAQNYESMAEAALMLMLNLMYQLRAVEGVMNGLVDRKSTRLNSSHIQKSRMPSSA